MLVLGLGGFGVTNFGGSVQSIGSVGDEEIGADEYARTLQQELRAMSRQMGQNVTLEQANQLSLTLYGRSTSDRVLARLYTTAALDNETADLGLSVGDEEVRERLLQVPAFQGLDGNFDRESYRFALRQAGMNEREFEQSLRKDVGCLIPINLP